jgi:hypothetical protein
MTEPTEPVVTLSWHEIILAGTVGVRRRVEGLRLNLNGGWSWAPNTLWEADIVGALAELALAKFLGVYWDGAVRVQERTEGDVGPFQVRATEIPKGSLILHERDRDEAIFHLVVVEGATCRLKGFITGAEGKRPGFWDDSKPHPAFFVPQSALHPVSEAK